MKDKYLLITQDGTDDKGFVYRVKEYPDVKRAYTAWIKGKFNGYIAKTIDPRVVDR